MFPPNTDRLRQVEDYVYVGRSIRSFLTQHSTCYDSTIMLCKLNLEYVVTLDTRNKDLFCL